MMIIASFLLAFSTLLFCGYGIVRISKGSGEYIIPVGYALSQLLFFVFYLVFFSALKAVIGVFLVLSLVNILSLLSTPLVFTLKISKTQGIQIVTAVILAVLMAAWPYLSTGYENYWHSGNEDVFEAIDGRNAYLTSGVAFKEVLQDVERLGVEGAKPIDKNESAISVFIGDPGRFQYSSNAFWSILLGAEKGIDAWLIQAFANLVMMGYGLFLLYRRTLPISASGSFLLALASVGSNFYLGSFFSGHQGSLMFLSVLPFCLLLVLDFSDRRRRSLIGSGLLLSVLLIFIIGAYPYPMPYIIIALAIYFILLRYHEYILRNKLLVLIISCLLLFIFYATMWILFDPIRERASTQFRSWGSILNIVGFFQYWGIWPSVIPSASMHFMTWLLDSSIALAFSLILGLGLSCLTIFGLYRVIKLNYIFIASFMIMWLIMFPFMYFMVGDSYYVYKFLYINSFFVIALTYVGYDQIAYLSLSKPLLFISRLLIVLWFALNITGNSWGAWVISDKLYNSNTVEFRNLAPVLRDIVNETYIDIPKRGIRGSHAMDYESVVRSYLFDAGMSYEADPLGAKYYLRMNGVEDIFENSPEKVIWKSELFRLIQAPPISNRARIFSFWAPEYHTKSSLPNRDGRFRWVSDGDNNWLSLDVINLKNEAKFMYFCAESGPSINHREILLEVKDAIGNNLGKYNVQNYTCHWVDIANRQGPFRISSEVIGRPASLIDTRHLNFRVFKVGLSPNQYDLSKLRYLNEPNDIVGASTLGRTEVYLSSGWYGLESQDGELFRWGHSGAEIVLAACKGTVTLDIAPGYSLGGDLNLNVRSASRSTDFKAKITKRTVIQVPIYGMSKDDYYLHLFADSKRLNVPGDLRQLDFRVFGVGCKSTIK